MAEEAVEELSSLVLEEATDQIDAEALLDGGSLEEHISAERVGAAVGAELGERIGRELGETIGRSVHESLAAGVERGASIGELATEVKEAVVDALRTVTGTDEDDGDGLASSAREAADEGRERVEDVTPDLSEEGDDDGDGLASSAREAAAEGRERVEDVTPDLKDGEAEETVSDEEDEETASEDEEDAPSLPDADDLGEFRRETLSEFLELLSYRDLQSIAKDLDVRANLTREEMTEAILETVADDAGSGDGTDGESAAAEESDDEAGADASNEHETERGETA
ncbi:putative sodium/potassium/calcium exchanger [Natronobiforma cellulositropha]|uniref:hypothetical protein n=1 Tax=Natronobiforma cellulositropha TaxID=1679076 RepID=UPI0021D5E10E|nr:hypothetical protein [Natronobiforma cellulositropha]